MKYEYLSNKPLREAVEEVLGALKNAGTKYQTERIPVRAAHGRITAHAEYAKRSSPHYLTCAMDGIALKSDLLKEAGENDPVYLGEGDYIRVDTGDPLPTGCDCVVMIEQVVETLDGSLCLYSSAPPWSNVRQIGEDISMGDMILPSFSLVSPAMIGALLAGGIFELEVVKRPCVAIIPTGDEIVSADADLKDGDIPEYNSAIFSAMLSEWGADAHVYPIIKDDPQKIREAVKEAADRFDAVIILAGSSAGRDDYTSSVVESLGTLIVHGIAIKPGKPAIAGHIGTVPVVGVPGYPVSGIIVMEQIVRPVISLLTMAEWTTPDPVPAVTAKKIPSSLKYEEFIRCQAAGVEGKIVAVPMNRGAGIVSGFSKAAGLLHIPQNSEGMESGESVQMLPLRSGKTLENTISVIGSHDPLIDEIADILIRSGREKPGENTVYLSSSHVGSMGAITAVKNGEAHLGGIHLLDTATGEYNRSYVQKYFPSGGAVLVKGVRRIQGLMLPKGNPKGIKGIKDLPGLSYVNRQKGAGTRILLDYLLGKEGISPADIYGYTKEEYTHTAVAAAIAAGTADCGMGIYSAAITYDLDFLPLWDEEYDFLVSEAAMQDEKVRKMLDVLKSSEFKDRLEKLGGYSLG